MIYTGVDADKVFSVEKPFLKKDWRATKKLGKKICVIPSDLCLVKVEQAFSKKISEIKSFYTLDVEERYGRVNWDVSLHNDLVFLGVYRNFTAQDCFNVELEVFALARVLQVLGYQDGYLLDMGRRKTTLVKCEGGLLKSYRVILKGGDYLTDVVSQKRGITKEHAERWKIEKGLELEEVLQGIKHILSSVGLSAESEPLILSGGGSKTKDLKDLLPKAESHHFCEPELTSAFGASLKFIVKNPYPDFVKRELTDKELKVSAILAATSMSLFFASYLLLGFLWSSQKMESIEREEFKKTFPNEPIVSLYDQVKSKVSTGEPYELTKKLSELTKRVKQGVKIYSIEFAEGSLRIKGEGKEEVVSLMKPQKVKKTPTGSVEFELEIK